MKSLAIGLRDAKQRKYKKYLIWRISVDVLLILNSDSSRIKYLRLSV